MNMISNVIHCGFSSDDLRIYKEILLRDCQVVQFSNGGHLLAIAIKEICYVVI